MSFKKMKRYIYGVFSDYGIKSTQSAEEANTIFVSNVIAEGVERVPWYKKSAHTFEERDIRDWITSIVPLGKRHLFINELSKKDISNGTLLTEMGYLEFYEIIQSVSKGIEIKSETKVSYMMHFTHFQWCFNNRRSISKTYNIVMKKFMKMFYIEEYYFLLNNVMLDKFEDLGESTVKDNCRHVFGYSLIILDRERIYETLISHFEEMMRSGENEFVVKLILIDQLNDNAESAENRVLQKKTKTWFSPILYAIPFLNPEFGIFHVGIQLGSEKFYCEWTTNSIILLKPLQTTSAVCTIDLNPIIIAHHNYDHVANSITDTIHKWNCEKEYSLVSLNCQHFAMDLLKALDLGLEQEKGGAFKKFLSQMKQSGSAEMVMKPSQDFVDKYIRCGKPKEEVDKEFLKFLHPQKDGIYVFDKHRYLDQFCLKILRNCGDGEEERKELEETSEWKLLHSWDECFWIKYFNCTEKKFEREEYEKLKYYCMRKKNHHHHQKQKKKQQQNKKKKEGEEETSEDDDDEEAEGEESNNNNSNDDDDDDDEEEEEEKGISVLDDSKGGGEEILCPFIGDSKGGENEIFEKILKKEEEWNISWYSAKQERMKRLILATLKEEKQMF